MKVYILYNNFDDVLFVCGNKTIAENKKIEYACPKMEEFEVLFEEPNTKMKSIIEVDKKVYEPKHFNNTMPFGKYKGRLIGDIIQEDPSYLLWCCENLSFELDEECLDLINCSINKEK